MPRCWKRTLAKFIQWGQRYFEDKTNQRERRGRQPATFHLQSCICQFNSFFVCSGRSSLRSHAWCICQFTSSFVGSDRGSLRCHHLSIYFFLCRLRQAPFTMSCLVHLSIYFVLCRLRQALFTMSCLVHLSFPHHQQGRIDFNTVNPSLSAGKDLLIHSL